MFSIINRYADMRFLIGICLATLLLYAGACTPEEEILSDAAVSLTFSRDTVNFDTLFTDELSRTERLRVFNPGKEAVLIDQIFLNKRDNSPYTIYVNGRSGKAFSDQLLLGGDSLLILVETRLPQTNEAAPYVANDAIVFSNKGNVQEVPVVGYGQNVQKLSKSFLECNTVWSSTIPYLIDDTVVVRKGCSLTIEKGTRIYFKPKAALLVAGTLIAEGDTAQKDRIVFRNHRLESFYENQLGQWGGIIFLKGSTNNILNYCDIRNARYGIYLGTPDNDDLPDLVIGNSRIENMLEAGIVCFTSDLYAYNTLVNNCAKFTVANLAGGTYTYQHCTFANYYVFQRETPSFIFADNVVLTKDSVLVTQLNVKVQNSILVGALEEELLIDNNGGVAATVLFENNILKTSQQNFPGTDNITTKDPAFVKFVNRSLYNYRLDSLSPAINAGKNLGILKDKDGKERDSKPDIGAYEWLPKANSGE